MANTTSQSEAIRDLLVEKLELYNSSLDVSTGSPLWNEVVYPVFQALGSDPFDTDIYEFLRDRIKQEFPTIGAEEGDVLVDLLITPLELLLEPLKREIQIVRRGQSIAGHKEMRLEDAKDLAANFFTDWRGGARALTSLRVYFSSPTFVNIFTTAAFTTSAGLKFYPVTSVSVRPEVMLLQRSGTEYYADVLVIAETAGEEYNVAKGTITNVEGISGWARISNLSAVTGGEAAETASELLARTRTSLAERSLNVRRGIVSRLKSDFPGIVDVEAIGYGDPEMDRDILTGGGEGSVMSTGICVIVGQFVLMFSMFEQRGELGTAQVSVGDEIELNYWKFLYDVDASGANETFTIDTILFDSRSAITEMPSVLLFRIDGAPSVGAPIAGSLPGVLPGVFCVVRSTGKLEISDIPGGIQAPDTARGTIEIEDGEVHIGGHYDVWVRPGSTSVSTAEISTKRSEISHLEGDDLVTAGESSEVAHLVHRKYEITYAVSSNTLQVGERVTGDDSGASAVIHKATKVSSGIYKYELKEMNGIEFEVEVIRGSLPDSSGNVGIGGITVIDSYDFVADGVVDSDMLLSVVSGSDEGVYRILKVEGPFLYLSTTLTTTEADQYFRIISEVTTDLFDPKRLLIPFGDAEGLNLRTTIGSKVVRSDVNLQDYGAEVGDTLQILEGDDQGTYTIEEWDASYGGTGAVLTTAMTGTNSRLSYRAYTSSNAVQRPFVRIQPGGVAMLDPSGQDSGYLVPYALPVEGLSKNAFSGSRAVSAGANGFLLMDPGSSWAPTDDYVVDVDGTTWAAITKDGTNFKEFYEDGNFKRVYTDEALDCEGYLAVFSVYTDGFTYLESELPSTAQDFLASMKEWFLDVISTFNFGGDETQLVELFSPLKFGPHEDPASVELLMQFEICIPFEVFDGCNNVFMAIPEFDWESEFEGADTFEDAMDDFNDGSMAGRAPALLDASPGDVITLLAGANAGAYVVDKVYEYQLVLSSHITSGVVDMSKAYRVALAVIRDQFPVPAFQGLEAFFDKSISWTVPSAPNLPFTVTDDSTGAVVSSWGYVETALTWFFEWMRDIGFDLPKEVSLDVPETMKAFWQLLFTGYIVGKPTADQYTRLYFLEPTSCTVYAPQVCTRYQYALPDHTGTALVGEVFTLPLPDLEDLAVSLTVVRLSGTVELSGTLAASANTAATVSELAALLQAALDADEDYVLITGPETATGALTITQVIGGTDEWTYVAALEATDGFRWLGFFESEVQDPAQAGGRWVEATGAVASGDAPYETIDHTLTWGFRFWDVSGDITGYGGTGSTSTLALTLGETFTGQTSGETAILWAYHHNTTTGTTRLWFTSPSGSFNTTEDILGGTSASPITLTGTMVSPPSDTVLALTEDMSFTEVAAAAATEWEIAVKDALVQNGDHTTYDEVELPAGFATSVEWDTSAGDGSGKFVFSIEDDAGVAMNFTLNSPAAGSDFLTTYVAAALSSSTDGVLTGDDYTPTYTNITFAISSESILVDFGLSYDDAVAFKADVLDLIDAASYEEAAQFLNADSRYYEDTSSGLRAIEWYDDSGLAVRAILGGESITAVFTTFSALGFAFPSVEMAIAGTNPDTNTITQGTTAPDDTTTVFYGHKEPTLLVAAAGAAELLFVPSAEAASYLVFPGQDEEGDIDIVDLPRDIHVGSSYDDQVAVELAFSDVAFDAPIEFGAQEGPDLVYIYEQRRFLEHTTEESDAMISRDRVIAIVTSYGSNKVSLPDYETVEFNFLSPNSGLLEDEVQVGDIIFLEEGETAGGYTIIARTATELTLDRTLDEATATIYRYGRDGEIVPDDDDALFTSPTAAFTEDDIGRYVTVWACNREEMDGSFKVTAVSEDGVTATLDTDVFEWTEQDIHWAVVKAPEEDPSDSEISGRTALVGLRPVRIYSGEPSEWRVVRVTPELEREDARIFCSFGSETAGPKQGVKQPYKIVRPGVQHLSSTAMSGQQSGGLYYFDVLSHSLGGDDVYNIPKGVRMEPVFGTYDSDGYRLETADPRLVLSPREETTMVMSGKFLPVGFEDEPSNYLPLEGKAFRVTYDYAPTAAQVQKLMSGESDRVLCSNVLVRHFLPSYVYFTASYEGGNSKSKVGAEIQEHINALTAVDEIDVSKLEKILHANLVTRYDHPLEVITLTHDLDRRIVGHRSDSRLSDDDIAFNGTNRTTFFIAGKDHSSEEDETDIPDGERIYLSDTTPTPTLR